MKSELQTISLPKAIKPEHCFKDIETEGVLPDYSPDISRLVRVDAAPCVENVRCDDKCEISGKLVFGLLYESDYKSKLAYTTFTVPFELKCDALAAKEIYPDVRCDCTYLTCRLLGQRKVSIKAKLDAYVIGQERAKRAVSVAVYNHYKRVILRQQDELRANENTEEKA